MASQMISLVFFFLYYILFFIYYLSEEWKIKFKTWHFHNDRIPALQIPTENIETIAFSNTHFDFPLRNLIFKALSKSLAMACLELLRLYVVLIQRNTKKNNTTQYVLDTHYSQTNTNTVNKTWTKIIYSTIKLKLLFVKEKTRWMTVWCQVRTYGYHNFYSIQWSTGCMMYYCHWTCKCLHYTAFSGSIQFIIIILLNFKFL
jgi:hypothetical protein